MSYKMFNVLQNEVGIEEVGFTFLSMSSKGNINEGVVEDLSEI